MTTTTPPLFPLEALVETSDDYYTPRWVFDALGLRFDLDVCAPPGGVPWIPADRWFTKADDGLSQPWEGRVWMNPPFSSPAVWVGRFLDHANGIALLPFAKSAWFGPVWRYIDGIVFGGVELSKFISGGLRSDIFMPCCLAAMGEESVAAIAKLGRVR